MESGNSNFNAESGLTHGMDKVARCDIVVFR